VAALLVLPAYCVNILAAAKQAAKQGDLFPGGCGRFNSSSYPNANSITSQKLLLPLEQRLLFLLKF